MKQAILELIDRYMEERTPYKEKMPLHKTLGYEVCHGGYIVLQELREEIEKMDEWIPVTEKLPEQFEDVLVYGDKWMCVDNLGNRHTYKNGFSRHMDVTHWMPLPPNPSFHE